MLWIMNAIFLLDLQTVCHQIPVILKNMREGSNNIFLRTNEGRNHDEVFVDQPRTQLRRKSGGMMER